MKKSLLSLFALAILLIQAEVVYPGVPPAIMKIAQSVSSGSWDNPATWSNNLKPDDSTFVIINGGHNITMGSNARCESIQIKQTGSLDNASYELLIRFMPWAHGISWPDDDGGNDPGYLYSPVNSSWDITDVNNGTWNMIIVDGTYSGSGNTIISLIDDETTEPNAFGGTIAGSGSFTTTGSLYYRFVNSNTEGLKFNSACNISFYGDINLISDEGWPGGGSNLTARNFGTISLMGSANLIMGATSGMFYNNTGAEITLESGSLYIGPSDGEGVFLSNNGTITIQNGDLNFAHYSYVQNEAGTISVVGDIVGYDDGSYFLQTDPSSVLSVGGSIFAGATYDALVSYGMGDYVIYSGTSPQEILIPIDPNTFSPPGPYSNLIIDNSAGITLNTDLTVTDSLIIRPGAGLTVNSANTITYGTLTIESDATGTGTFISGSPSTAAVERYISGYTDATHGWHLLSSPVGGQAISSFHTPGQSDDFYKWDETTDTWINRTAAGGILNTEFETTFGVGTGYLVSYANTDTKLFSGSLNNSDVTVSGLSYTGSSSAAGWHLLGNPFSSALVWNDGNWNLSNVDANCQIWDEQNASYTVISPNGIIPSMNGFMAHASAEGASLKVPAASRTHDVTNWYKSSNYSEQIVLKVHDDAGNTSQSTILRFDQDATAAYDNEYDSYFIPGFAPQFYSTSQQESYALNTLPEVFNGLTIPLCFVKNTANLFTMEVTENSNDLDLYLIDKQTMQTINIREGSYTFSSGETDDPDRFELHFGVLGLNNNPTISNDIRVWAAQGRLFIQNCDETAKVTVTDLQGRSLFVTYMDSDRTSPSLNLPTGIYIVSVQTQNRIESKKVIIR